MDISENQIINDIRMIHMYNVHVCQPGAYQGLIDTNRFENPISSRLFTEYFWRGYCIDLTLFFIGWRSDRVLYSFFFSCSLNA